MSCPSHRIRAGVAATLISAACSALAQALPNAGSATHRENRVEALCSAQGEADIVKTALDGLLGGNAFASDPRSVRELAEAAEVSRERTRYDDAQWLFALAIARGLEQGVDAEPDVASNLAKLAQIFQWRSVYADAKALYQCAGEIQRRRLPPDDPATAMTIALTADFERQFDHLDEAESLYRNAIGRLDAAGNRSQSELAFAVSGLAHVLSRRNASDPQVLDLYRQAVALNEADIRCFGECLAAAVSQDNLGQALISVFDYPEAELHLQRALTLKLRLRGADHDTSATTYNALARLYEATCDLDSALAYHRKAVATVYVEAQAALTPNSAVLSRLAQMSDDLARFLDATHRTGDGQDAVFFYKQSVNARQLMRAGAAKMDATYRDSLARVVADTYYRLARLLSTQGRLGEAEQVLLALKDAEFFQFVRGSVETGASPVTLTPQEIRLQSDLEDLAHRLAAARVALEASDGGVSGQADAKAQANITALQVELIRTLDAATARLAIAAPRQAALAPISDSRLVPVAKALSQSASGESVAIVMYAPEKHLTTVIVTASDGTTAVPLGEGDGTDVLYPLINEMRSAIQARADASQPSRALYKKLVAPVLAHLRERKLKPTTLMLYLTGRLRLLPFAALVDDDGRFLAEDYRLSSLSPLSIPGISEPPKVDWSVQAFGSSIERPGLKALPAVEDELAAIVRSEGNSTAALPGEQFLNERFTRSAWQSALRPGLGAPPRSTVIHVATHFSSPPGENWLKSFLLLGTGDHYPVSDLAALEGVDLRELELITLSACSTELGDMADGSEFEGLGMVFQKMGAPAVIGTLWAIDDRGGSLMMKAFYAARGAHRIMSKAAALQWVQVEMIHRRISSDDSHIDASLPYYWAPFVLVGNWR